MLFKNKLSLTRLSFITAFGIVLYGCASSGIQTPTGEQATNVVTVFERGEARLNCELSCAGAWGAARINAKKLYEQGLWRDLAIEVSRVGFKSDLTYFYLGRAAEGLGLAETSITYYKSGLASPYKCAGFLNNCDGMVFPDDITAGINRLAAPTKVETPVTSSTVNLKAPSEITPVTKGNVVTEPQSPQILNPSAKVEFTQAYAHSNDREELDKATKQNEDADQPSAESKAKPLSKVRKATTKERSLIISAVNQNLFDSDSAKYRDIYLIQNSYACAEVNAKNRFGGYTGFTNVVLAYLSGSWIPLESLKNFYFSCPDLITKMHTSGK